MVGPLTPKPGESAADFKLRIEQSQREMAAQRTPTTPSEPAAAPKGDTPTASVPAPQPAAKAPEASLPSVPPAQPPAEPAKPAAEAPPTPPTPRPGDQVEPLEWARKKGLKTPEDIARSLRALETEFHRRNQMPPAPAPSAPAPTEQPRPPAPYVPPVPPPYPPRPEDGGYPPPYQPVPRFIPQPAPLPRNQVQWLADTYQIPVEDAERLAPMMMDMVAAAQRRQDQRFTRLERDNARNSEMFRLMQDPSFQHPEVQFEMHRILEEEPRIFELEPAPYTVAFNKALVSIARKHVATGQAEVPAPEAPPMSSRPPTTLGGDGGAGGGAPKEGAPLTPETFNRLPLEKKREALTAIGARPRA